MSERSLTIQINENYKAAKKILTSEIQGCAGVIRKTLELATKLFWIKKYGKEPVWNINGREQFKLSYAINDEKFFSYFNEITIADMRLINKVCNNVLHSETTLTISEAQELMSRLEQCLKAISKVLGIELISNSEENNVLGVNQTKAKTTNSIQKMTRTKTEITEAMCDNVWQLFTQNKRSSFSRYHELAEHVFNETGMNQNSAYIYFIILSSFVEGKFNTRLMKFADLAYYLERILKEYSSDEFASTLKSLESSIPYWQEHKFGKYADKVQNLVNQYKSFI